MMLVKEHLRVDKILVFLTSVPGVTRVLGNTWKERQKLNIRLGVEASMHFKLEFNIDSIGFSCIESYGI